MTNMQKRLGLRVLATVVVFIFIFTFGGDVLLFGDTGQEAMRSAATSVLVIGIFWSALAAWQVRRDRRRPK